MGKLTDVAIRAWIRSGERFEGRSDGDGLVLTWREKRTAPSWRLRYRFSGKPRVMEIGSYSDLTLAAARQAAKELRAKIALGHDVAGEKQERKSTALARIEAARSVTTVNQLADEYFERMINGRWKHPNIVRSRIEKDIKPHLGKLALDAVEPRHIDAMLRAVVKRGAPTIANDVLRWVRRMFDYAIKRHMVRFNPAAAFDLADAGGKELARERALSRDELVTLFEAMRQAKGFSVQNELTVKLLLLLAVRKGELIAARWDEFELEADPPVWHLPGIRTKTGQPLDIPLPAMAVEWLQKLKELACNAAYVLPARKLQTRMVPHVCESTMGVAMGKVKHGLPHFTVHDFRRTARTHLAALGVEPHVAERCLNHKLKGVEGVYNRHDYFEERRRALDALGAVAAEAGTRRRDGQGRQGQGTLTPGVPDFDDAAMALHRIKLTLPPDLREYVARRVAQDGYVNAGEYMRQLIRSDATDQQDRRLGDRLAADETRRGGTPAGDSR